MQQVPCCLLLLRCLPEKGLEAGAAQMLEAARDLFCATKGEEVKGNVRLAVKVKVDH